MNEIRGGNNPPLNIRLKNFFLSVMPQGQIFFVGPEKFYSTFGRDSAPDENISAPQKIESAPDAKNPSHASGAVCAIIHY